MSFELETGSRAVKIESVRHHCSAEAALKLSYLRSWYACPSIGTYLEYLANIGLLLVLIRLPDSNAAGG